MALFQHTPGAPTLESVFQHWHTFCEKPPKGFEKYFKPGSKDAGKKQSGKSQKSASKEESSFPKQSSKGPSSNASSRPSQQDNWSFGMFGSSG